jgi:hypothetical protein
MSLQPTRLPAPISVYCAHCRERLGDSEEKYLYTRVCCPKNPKHIAAVVKGGSGEFWLRIEALILKWEAECSPIRWFNTWGGLFTGRAGWYLAARFVLLILFLVMGYYLPASPIWRGVLAVFFTLCILLLLWDTLVSNTSIAFVSRFPANPLRTAILTAFAFVQIAIAFAVLYILYGDFNRNLNPISAIYFSFVTITTLGYGDIHLTQEAWLGQLIVICQLVVGVYFAGTILAVVASWSNAPPSPPPLVNLSDVISKKDV